MLNILKFRLFSVKKPSLALKMMLIVLLAMSTNLMAAGTQPSGSGTAVSPYQVSTLNNLLWISTTSSSWDKYFEQTTNIDASGTSTWNGGAGFSPIGNSETKFIGSYDGKGFAIDGLTINRGSSDNIGQFGYTVGASIANLGVTNVNITGRSFVGGLVGYNSLGSTVSNCYSTGNVSGSVLYTGGLVGCTFSETTVTKSYSTATVSGSAQVGGLVGNICGETSIISYCYSTGNVSGSGFHIGGLVGISHGGYAKISNSYSRGNVTNSGGTIYAGAFCGSNNDNDIIEYCYSTGSVTSGSATDRGFVGFNSDSGTYTNNFWDRELSNQSTATGATAKTTAEMKTLSTFTTAGWDFTTPIWKIDGINNDGYPYLNMAAGTQPSGSGTAVSPYQVSTLNNLLWISTTSSSWDKYFEQTTNIDASGTSTWNGGAGFSPIGNSETKFTGSYDGKGFAIDGLTINRGSSDNIGQFGYTVGASIANLGVTNVNITGRSFVGGLVGYNSLGSTVSNCYSTGNVSGSVLYTGGLVGCTFSETTVTKSYSTATVSGSAQVGGLVGNICGETSIISYCYSTGNVSGSGFHIGGLVGISHGGYAKISNSYSRGNVTNSGGTIYAGAFCGSNNDNDIIEYCYSTGSVTSGSATDRGFVGFNSDSGTYTNNFWDRELSNQSTATGATAKTTAEMKTLSTFTTAGWDFTTPIWKIDGINNDGYPYLNMAAGTQPSGSGTAVSPYQVSTLNNLLWISTTSSSWDKYFEQTTNIDASGTSTWNGGAGFSPIGNSETKFTGSYDGKGFAIDGLTINRGSSDNIGQFGYTVGASIANLGVTNVNITGRSFVGGLVGYNSLGSTVSNCYSTGNVSGSVLYTGGLVGCTFSETTVTKSYSTATVSGSAQVGGLVGNICGETSIISYCYSTGNVSGSGFHIGGLVGISHGGYAKISNSYSRGNVTNSGGTIYAGAFCGSNNDNDIIEYCYSTGSVTSGSATDRGFVGFNSDSGTYTNNFWDRELSNQSTATGATAKTTAEMKTLSTFTTAGWDFTTPIWKIDGINNDGYPYLNLEASYTSLHVCSDGNCGGKPDCHTTIAGAVAAAESGAIIKVANDVTYSGDVTVSGKTLTIQGGWDTTFENQSGTTTIQGAPSVSNGSITLEQVKVIP